MVVSWVGLGSGSGCGSRPGAVGVLLLRETQRRLKTFDFDSRRIRSMDRGLGGQGGGGREAGKERAGAIRTCRVPQAVSYPWAKGDARCRVINLC